MTIMADDFFAARENAKTLQRDPNAEAAFARLPWAKRAALNLVPIKVDEVDFGEGEDGSRRRLPLYLFTHKTAHKTHLAIAYPNGFPGHNERLVCPCGYMHYMSSVALGHAKALGELLFVALRYRVRGKL